MKIDPTKSNSNHIDNKQDIKIKGSEPVQPSDDWSTDKTQVNIDGKTQALVYKDDAGDLIVNSAEAGGNSSIDFDEVNPGSVYTLSFNLHLEPPLSAEEIQSYDRLSLYYTYVDNAGQKKQLAIPIHLNTKGQYSLMISIPKDAKPSSPLTVTLHHEKDWGSMPMSAIFSHLLFTSPAKPTPPSPGPSPAPSPQTGGSGMSDLQEYQALENDPNIQQLLAILEGKGSSDIDPTLYKDFQALLSLKKQYQGALAAKQNPAQLNEIQKAIKEASQKMLSRLIADVYSIIESAPKDSLIGSIALDYDTSHEQQMIAHVESLVTMLLNPPGKDPIVPSQQYVPPAVIDKNNLIDPSKWVSDHGTQGSWHVDPNASPSGDEGAITIDNRKATKSDYYEIHQTIDTHSTQAGDQYLVAAYVKGPISDGKGDYLPATLTVSGDINYNGVQYSPQSYSDSCGTNQWHLVYFVVTADKANAKLQLDLSAAAGGIAQFSHLQVIPIGRNQSPEAVQKIALDRYPAPSIAGNPGLGPFPQKQSGYTPGENLMDWPPSNWKNADTKSAYPYWGLTPPFSTIINGKNGNKAIQLSPTSSISASITGYSPALVPPNEPYQYSCDVTIPNPPGDTFPTLTITAKDYSTTPPTTIILAQIDPKNDPDLFPRDSAGKLIPGTHHIEIPIDTSQLKNAVQIIPSWSAYKGTGSFAISNMKLSSSDPKAYRKINAINPYDSARDIYQSQHTTFSRSWDFANPGDQNDLSDWGMSLVGNDICNPQAKNVSFVPGKGLVLTDTVHADGSIDDAGIQSTFMTAPGQPFHITTHVQFNNPNSPNKPVFALWTYGETQKGDQSPLTHKSAGGSDMDNECDFELCPPNAEYPNGYFRAVTYAGFDAGGKPHSFINIPLKPGCNLWDGKPHSITLNISPLANGKSSVTWEVTGSQNGKATTTSYTYSTSPEQPGYPIGDSGTYLKIATEQPYGWPGYTKHPGTSSFTISNIDYTQDPLPSGVEPPPLSDTDYSYYMPGKGFAYTPFPSDFFYKKQ